MVLNVDKVVAEYSANQPVLREISLQVAAGEIAAVIGPNGCGKSTLLRCISGLLKPASGSIFVNGKAVEEYSARERAQQLALLAQSYDGSQEMTVEEMVILGRTPFLSAYGAPSTQDHEVVARVMAQTNTAQFRERNLSQLSGGERQRVLLARALAQEPKVLLLDEPTSNLDIRYQFEILDLVYRLARSEKLAVVLVLHQINLAAAVADTILLLNQNGSTCACGSPQDVMTREHLAGVYGVPLEVDRHPTSGRPQARADWSFGNRLPGD